MLRTLVTLPDLRHRHRERELMDAPGLDPTQHVQALEALAKVNRISGVAARVWKDVLHLSGERGVPESGEPLRLLDVACGGGDVMLDVARRARSADVPLEVHGCDVSPVALGHARGEAVRWGLIANFIERDVLSEGLPEGYDLVCSSLFHHHLSDADAVNLLRGMAAAGDCVLVQDLLRSTVGYMLAWTGLRILSRSRVAHVDGPLSVRAAFNLSEVRSMAEEAGLAKAVIRRGWPERFILRWNEA